MKRSCAIYATGVVGALLLIVGIALQVAQVFQTMIQERIKKEITLAENSRVFESWVNPPPLIYMQYFFFNITNPEEFKAGREKPRVVEMGPYTYREYRSRENVTFLENGTKILSTNPKSFVFLPEMSKGDPTVDKLTTANIPFIVVMNEMSSYPFFVRPLVSMYIKSLGVDLFMTRTVHEVLWGFKDPLMSQIHKLKPSVDEFFGLMYKKNGTHDGEFVLHTGEKNYLDYGKIDSWNGIKKMNWWSSDQSNMINGTDGSVFHTFLSRKELLYVFAADMCRSIHLAYVHDTEVKGIPAFRFALPDDVLAAPSENPSNAGFCVPAGDCLGKGVLKVGVCHREAPIVVSFPHFYQAESKYIDAVEGMHPNKEEHETYLDLNPTTGILIRASKRAQLNIIMKRVPGFPQTKFLNETIFPITYINETATIDDDSASQMKKLLLIISLVSNSPVIIVVIGVVLLLVFIFLVCWNCKKKNEIKRIDFTKAFRSCATKDDAAYNPISNESDESPESTTGQAVMNGSYISMSPIEEQKC